MECELYAFMNDDGQLVIEVDSKECQQAVIAAISEKGVSVRNIKPKQPMPQTELG